ncbi:MAG: hypothetical protein FJ278_03470, partial [Planctomycetes bacterium]|nr:hypothetical protein [Planctomycetota bacterium]
MKLIFIALLAGFWFAARLGAQEEHVGERPYEMVWANRTEDTHPALLDFESVEGWTAETKDTVATLTRTREQQLWGKYVAKLVYRVEGERGPAVTLRPPKPVTVPGEFDCVNFWIYGNNWGWMPDASTPPVGVAALFKTTDGKDLRVSLGSVRWKEWWVMHKKLAQAVSGAQLVGIEFTNCRNKQDRALYLDNLACYKEQLPALTFEPRPKRGIEMFPGQGVGLSMGPGKLPFPTREETILPDNLTKGFKTALAQDGAAFVFKYEGDDGVLEYRYEPKTGTLGDVTAAWRGRGAVFQPMADGGVMFATEGKAATPEKLEKLECKREGETVVSRWRATLGERTAEVTYTLRLWQKSLVVDVKCLGGLVGEFRVGRAMGVENPRLVTLPYLVCGAARPAVLVMGPADKPLFLFAMLDWYRSNASMLMAENRVAPDGVTYNGGSTYNPKTDGKRND